jgi:integrase
VVLPVHPELRKVLDRWPARTDALFPGEARTYDHCRQNLSQQFYRLMVSAGIGKVEGERRGFHSLRATFATRARVAGIPLEDLRGILGHVAVGMTRRYTDAPGALSLDAYPALRKTAG